MHSQNFEDITDQEWRERLTDQEYHVLREKGTQRAFSGKYTDYKQSGTYHCKGCHTALFSSNHKYDSGSGWPSFYDEISPGVIQENKDTSHGMIRIEIICATCKGHLGHVFKDGPKPTGLRYCVNSISLQFK